MKYLIFSVLASAALVARQAPVNPIAQISDPNNPNFNATVEAAATGRQDGSQFIVEAFFGKESSPSSSSSSVPESSSSASESSSVPTSESTTQSEPSSETSASETSESASETPESSSETVTVTVSSESASSESVSESSSESVLPLIKRQVAFGSYRVNVGTCAAPGSNIGPFTGLVTEVRVPCNSIFRSVTYTFTNGVVACGNFNFPAVYNCGTTTTTRQTVTSLTTSSAAAAPTININQVTNVSVNVNIVVSNCNVCGVQTYYYLSAYVCTNTLPVVFFGISYPCPYINNVCYVTQPVVVPAGAKTTIQVAAVSTAPVVPIVTTTIQGQVVSVPASTLPNVVVATPSAPRPVVTYSGAANKLGLGAAAAIAGAAALL